MEPTTENWLIDCDAGVDDCAALLIAFANKTINIVAITCVFGNTTLDNVVKNVTKILEVVDRKIPVYVGAQKPLVEPRPEKDDYYGLDGLGDSEKYYELKGYSDCIQKEFAPNAIIRLAKEYETKGGLNIFACGPLTNMALAAKLDKGIADRVKKLFIMGGAWLSMGNSTLTAEFNFFMDPDSASITLRNYHNIHLVPIETTTGVFFDDKDTEELRSVDTKVGIFYKHITEVLMKDLDNQPRPLADSMPDAVALACALYSDTIIKTEELESYVDFKGHKTRGSLVSIWYKYGTYYDDVVLKPEKIKKIKIITEASTEKVKSLLKNALISLN